MRVVPKQLNGCCYHHAASQPTCTLRKPDDIGNGAVAHQLIGKSLQEVSLSIPTAHLHAGVADDVGNGAAAHHEVHVQQQHVL